MSAFNKINDPQFIGVTITDKKEVYPALRSSSRTATSAGCPARRRSPRHAVRDAIAEPTLPSPRRIAHVDTDDATSPS